MALETVRGLVELGGFSVINIDKELTREEYLETIKGNYIFANHKTGTLCFRLQDGPIKEVGVNGCQIDQVLMMTRHIIGRLNDRYPCTENEHIIQSIDSALYWSEKRKKDREARQVEGTSQQ